MMIKKLAVVAVIATAVGALAGCNDPTPTFSAVGIQAVQVDPYMDISARDAYPDITGGTPVTVFNSAGAVIGTGSLILVNSSSLYEEDFGFAVTVPKGLPRYGIQVGNSSILWFSEQEMTQGPGLCLGDGC